MQRATQQFLALTAACGTALAILAPTPKAFADSVTDTADERLNNYTLAQAVREEIEDIEDDTYEYIGQTVTVIGEVDEFLTPNIIRLEESDEFIELFDNDTVLVVSSNIPPMSEDQIDAQQVRVIGEVQELSVAEVEREFGFDLSEFEIRNEIEYEYEGRPVIYADSVEMVTDYNYSY